MRSLTAWLLLAFACGVCALQGCASLPPWPWSLAVLALAALAATVRVNRFAAVICAAVLGFGYAALRAEMRLADSLPREWEGEDIRIVGVVDDLPARTDTGVRFAFAVEAVVTPRARVPSRLSLAWFAPRDDEEDAPVVLPGERWQLDGPAAAAARQRQPGGFDLEAWLLQQNLRATGYVQPPAAQRTMPSPDAFAITCSARASPCATASCARSTASRTRA
jgi:competence protein ComEC